MIPDSLNETAQFARETGWVFVVSLVLRGYSLGGGTYTGIEAVSNNVQSLAEPRVSTDKWTVFYMALSLSSPPAELFCFICCGTYDRSRDRPSTQ